MPVSVLTIGTRTLNYVSGSLRVKHSYDRRCTARLSVESDTDLDFSEGEQIDLSVDGATLFRGLLLKPQETWPGPANRIYKLEGICFYHIPQQRLIARSYQNTAAGDIVGDIIDTILADEGVVAGTIAAGPTVVEAVFSYVSVARALDKLAELSDFFWHVDKDKALHFGPMTQFAASFDLTDIEEWLDSATAEKGNREYRNKQYIRGGKAETVSRTERWIGNGEQRTFVTGFPIAKQPTITVDSVSETIAVRGIGDPNADWFWSANSTEVTQNTSNTPVAADVIIELTYIGLFDIVIVSTDQQEADNRATIQGFGTGLVEDAATDTTVRSAASGFQLAASKLARYAVEGRALTWDTELQTDIAPGQSIVVDIPSHGFDDVTMFISEIEIRDVASRIIRTVRAIEGPDDGDWATWFGRRLSPTDSLAFRENIGEDETLIVLSSTDENWVWEEIVDETVLSCPIPSTSLNPNTSLLPC